MSAVWERLAGDTDVFAVKLAFRRDPDDGMGASFEEKLSWGSFQIWAKGSNICLHAEEGETVDSVHWYLLPLLEWLSSNWEFLLHEERLPARNAEADAWASLQATRFAPGGLDGPATESWEDEWYSWWTRHAIQSCRSGGLFPNAVFRRWRDRVEVSWGPSGTAGCPEHYRFLDPRGLARLGPSDVAQPLYEVLAEAAGFLHGRAPDSARLEALVQAVEAIKTTDPAKRLAIQSGLGEAWGQVVAALADVGEDVRQAILGTETTSLTVEQPCQAVLMFGSVSPRVEREDITTLTRWLVDLYSPEGEPEELCRHTENVTVSDRYDPPWEQGQVLADRLLTELSLLADEPDSIAIEQALTGLGVQLDEVDLRDEHIRAVAVAGPNHRPAVLSNRKHPTYQYPSGRRFTLAHELCHILFDRAYGRRLALSSGPWAPRDVEKRANAFAAMLLMPPELIGKACRHLTAPITEAAGVEEVARSLGTSYTSTLEHLCNLGFIDETDRDRLRDEAKPDIGNV